MSHQNEPTTVRSTSQPADFVSVIIPMRNGAEGLRLCLGCLARQTYFRDCFEVIVVDNGSTESLEALMAEFSWVKWLREEKPGSYAARNAGVLSAKGTILAFTDADCQPGPQWLESAVRALYASGATIVGGRIVLLDPLDRALNVYEILEENLFGMVNQRKLVEKRGFAVTANLTTLSAAVARVGPFDADLRSSGDREWVQRAVSKGEILKYADEAVVYHPRRSSFYDVYSKSRRIVGGKIVLMKKRKAGFARFAKEIFLESPLNPQVYLFAFVCPARMTLFSRMRLTGVVVVLCGVAMAEKIRVLCGGTAFRG